MSWLRSWDWTQSMEAMLTPEPPYSTRRSARNTGGLFDDGVTGVLDSKDASVWTTETATTTFNQRDARLSSSDLFDVDIGLEGGDDLLTCEKELMSSLSESVGLMEEDDFCEAFTNLSEFLLNDNIMEMTSVDEVFVEPSISGVTEGKAAIKRTASDAALDAPSLTPPANPDHNDYILKVKKARGNTKADDSDADDVPRTKTEKYKERRKKNNVASRRSRETRKQKFCTMEVRADQLEHDNEMLRIKVEQLEAMAKKMKDILVQKLAGK